MDKGIEITSKLPVLAPGIEVKPIILHADDSSWRWFFEVFWADDAAPHADSNIPQTRTPNTTCLACAVIAKHSTHQV